MDPLKEALAFTCLLPVHGGDDPAHFTLALESVVSGVLSPDEIFICQDGELPRPLARAVAQGVVACSARLIRNPGAMGLHHNLNHAAKEVTTPWLCRADADDINLPNRFAAQVAYLSKHPQIDVLGGAIEEFWPDGKSRIKSLPLRHEALFKYARFRCPINHMTAFVRTRLFIAAGGYPDFTRKEDYGLWIRLLARRAKFAPLAEVLVRARLGEDFYARRAGLVNIVTEWRLLRLKRQAPGMSGPLAWLVFIARSATLALQGPARLVYVLALRR